MTSANPTVLVTEELEATATIESLQPEVPKETTKDAACLKCGSLSSQGLEDVDEEVWQQRQSTSTLSSNDDVSGDEKSLFYDKTRCLARRELISVNSLPIDMVSVFQRSLAYNEMVASSVNCWNSNVSNTLPLDLTKRVKNVSKVGKGPFFQQDRHSKLYHQVDTKAHIHSEALVKKEACISPSSTRSSNHTSGISIKMRIKLWTEKEKEAQDFHVNRRSDQRRCTVFDVGDSERICTKTVDRGAQSDDEITTKSQSKPKAVKSDIKHASFGRSNPGCKATDKAGRELEKVSSSSSISSESSRGENLSLGATTRDLDPSSAPESKVSADRKSTVEAKLNKRKWKLTNPLSRYRKKSVVEAPMRKYDAPSIDIMTVRFKRPHTKKRKKSTTLSSKVDVDLSTDDAFSSCPVSPTVRTKLSEVVGSTADKIPDKLPSVFECNSSSDIAPVSEENQSVARDIRNIINSLGTTGDCLREESNGRESRSTIVDVNGRESPRTTTMDDDSRESPRTTTVDDDSRESPLTTTMDNDSRESPRTTTVDDESRESPRTTTVDDNDRTFSCLVSVDDDSNDSDGSTDEEEDEEDMCKQTNLDFLGVGRLDLKKKVRDSDLALRNTHRSCGRKTSFPLSRQNSESLIATSLIHGDAVWDRVALEADELSFTVGDEVEILDMSDDVWWYGNVRDSLGWFPASFIRLRVCQDPESEDVNSPPSSIKSWGSSTESSEVLSLHEDCQRHPPQPIEDLEPTNSPSEDGSDTVLPLVSKTFSMSKGSHPSRRMTIRRKDSMSSISPRKLTPKEVRGKIVEEILNTETAYVQHLEDIVEGYLKRCQAYNTLFDEEQIEIIFSNVEELYRFQRDFLQELQARVNKDCLEQSEIGEIFVINQHEFKVYSQYCNNHPNAVNEMNLLEGKEQYALFFESCRLLRNLQDISLGGFLLTPVQKICKYPLQLSELLKYTNEDHPDYRHVVAAQVAMKNVAMLINEQKRRIENMGKIGCWQKTIDGWKGPDLLETSSEMIHSGELQKISKGHSQERFFFLFDHQLIYCRKDTIGGKLGFKGRLNLDICRIHDYPDGSVLHGSTPVKNSWMMNNTAKDNKSYIIYAKSPQVKEKWMQAFRKERQIVRDDVERGFGVSMKMKKAAVSLCASSSEFRARRRSVHRRHAAVSESYDTVLKQKVENIGKRMTSPAMILAQATSPFPITKKSNKSRKKKNNSIPLVSSGPSKTAN